MLDFNVLNEIVYSNSFVSPIIDIEPYLLSMRFIRCNNITLWELHNKYQDAFFSTNKSFFSDLTNPPTGKPTKNCARTEQTLATRFFNRTDCHLQSNLRKTGIAKGRSGLVPVNLVGFPSVRPKMIGCFDGKIRPPVFGRYEGRSAC